MTTRRDFLATLSLLAVGEAAFPSGQLWAAGASPDEILLIRHAEKTEPNGDLHLNDRGRARAEALVRLFQTRFGPPAFLFAARQSKLSNHSMETIQPLAQHLRSPIDNRFADAKYRNLVAALMQPAYAGSRVLVCWHHETLPEFATALGAKGVPPKWHDKVFDVVWRLRYDAGTVTFTELYQDLLLGDRPAAPSPAQ